jgi:hypothetical protein
LLPRDIWNFKAKVKGSVGGKRETRRNRRGGESARRARALCREDEGEEQER